MTIAVIGAGPTDELGQAERVRLLDLRREHQHVDRIARLDEDLLRGGHALTQPTSSVSTSRARARVAERLRRPNGDDGVIDHPMLPFAFGGFTMPSTVSGSSSTPSASGGSSDR